MPLETDEKRSIKTRIAAMTLAGLLVVAVGLAGCGPEQEPAPSKENANTANLSLEASDVAYSASSASAPAADGSSSAQASAAAESEGRPEPSEAAEEGDSSTSAEPADAEEPSEEAASPAAEQADASASPVTAEDYRESFDHGAKPAANQKYIVLHDTESESDASGVIDYWDGSGRGVAAHFVVNLDGSVWQCVPLDRITHHAGYGDTGHNDAFGVVEDGRDDMVGTTPIGDWAADYGMNAWSVGIEMVHVGGSGFYPEEQLDALDALIAYIDGYFGFQSQIIDHKAWRSGNSDTSPEFAEYLANYQDHRTHA